MQTIPAMLGFPNGTPIDQTQVRIVKVYERREGSNSYGPYTTQDAYIDDAAGNKMKLKAWHHPDLARIEGQEVVIHSGKGGKGLKVVHETYKGKTTILLEAGKTAEFQTVAVFHANNPSAGGTGGTGMPTPPAAPAGAARAVETPAIVVRGDAAGMALNKAMDAFIHDGFASKLSREGNLENALVFMGAQILRASFRLQKGEGVVTIDYKPEVKPAAAPATVTSTAKAAPTPEAPSEDVPF